MRMNFVDHKLELDYPCSWSYTLIGGQEEKLRQAIDAVAGGVEHSVKPGNKSKTGKYCSLTLELEVKSEAMRIAIFYALEEQADVRSVL
mgnify:CR=1 FL=1